MTKTMFVLFLAGLGVLLLAVATGFALRIFPGAVPVWLLPGGLTLLGASWFTANLPG